jgi:chromosome segregation ATPase
VTSHSISILLAVLNAVQAVFIAYIGIKSRKWELMAKEKKEAEESLHRAVETHVRTLLDERKSERSDLLNRITELESKLQQADIAIATLKTRLQQRDKLAENLEREAEGLEKELEEERRLRVIVTERYEEEREQCSKEAELRLKLEELLLRYRQQAGLVEEIYEQQDENSDDSADGEGKGRRAGGSTDSSTDVLPTGLPDDRDR